jgi:FKBP-type peptidyl-prolyl cis-trans isomerase FklB
MKKYCFITCCLSSFIFVNAQKPVAKPVAKKTTTASTPVLKTHNDSLSYAIGLSVANFYHQQG